MLAFLCFNIQALDRRVFNIYRPDLRTAARIAESDDPSAPVVVVDDHRNNLYKCLLTYTKPALRPQVFPVRRVLESMNLWSVQPAPAVWFAIERPKGKPWQPLPEPLRKLYVAERTIELPYLTLTYNRPIRSVSAEVPLRK